ncbi:MAG: hypothetical protein ACKO8O_15030 [Betaproteobacteria bacterium]|nr:hypothetical protein [Betaproteobacteria bacterium]
MGNGLRDVIPLSPARAQPLDDYPQRESERIHLLLIDEAGKGLSDVTAGKVQDARTAIVARRRRRMP